MYYVYILRCRGNKLYTGIAKDVESRFLQHQRGKGARFTRAHPPESIAYCESVATRSDALKREYAVKQLSHQQKLQLVS